MSLVNSEKSPTLFAFFSGVVIREKDLLRPGVVKLDAKSHNTTSKDRTQQKRAAKDADSESGRLLHIIAYTCERGKSVNRSLATYLL